MTKQVWYKPHQKDPNTNTALLYNLVIGEDLKVRSLGVEIGEIVFNDEFPAIAVELFASRKDLGFERLHLEGETRTSIEQKIKQKKKLCLPEPEVSHDLKELTT